MNIEAYNLDSLRKLVRNLQKENKELRLLLDKAEIPYTNSEVFVEIPSEAEEYELDQGARIADQYINEYLVQKFFSMFWEEWMFLLREPRMVIIIRNVIIAGIIQNVPNKEMRKFTVKIANNNYHSWLS